MNPPQPPSPASPAASWFSGILPRGRSDKSSAIKMPANAGSGDPAGPIRGKNQFRGVLFKLRLRRVTISSKSFSLVVSLMGCWLLITWKSWRLLWIKRGGLLFRCFSVRPILDMACPACNKMLRKSINWLVISSIKKVLRVLYCLGKVQVVRILSIICVQMQHAHGPYEQPFCRYYSLCAYMGDDDMFSSDLSDDQLRTRLGHMSNTPCQVIFSMGDEYVPEYVDKKALVARLCKALGGAEKVEIEHGNHALSNRISEAVQAIINFIKQEGPKGWDDPWH